MIRFDEREGSRSGDEVGRKRLLRVCFSHIVAVIVVVCCSSLRAASYACLLRTVVARSIRRRRPQRELEMEFAAASTLCARGDCALRGSS